ncbi:MAG: DUF1552 domain-containing protein, partial [Myxococcota bacterium]
MTLGAGATLLTPLLRGLLREARGQDSDDLRLLLVSGTNGWWPLADLQFVPGEDKANRTSREFVERTTFDLPSGLAPIADYQDRMLFVDGLSVHEYEKGHYGGPPVFSGASGHITIDQWIASQTESPAPYRWMGFGMVNGTDLLADLNAVDGTGARVPFTCSPSSAYTTFFGMPSSEGDGVDPRRRRQLLLDFAHEDIRAARARLAGTEREKLDQYLAAIEELDRRNAQMNLESCEVPPITEDPSRFPDLVSAQFDLAATALGCGMTNVAWVSYGGSTKWPFKDAKVSTITGVEAGLHNLGHGDVPNSGALNMVWHKHFLGEMKRVMDRLDALPAPGGGSVLDRTVVVYTNENGFKHHNRGGRHMFAI